MDVQIYMDIEKEAIDWKLEEAEDNLRRARDQLLVLAATTPTDAVEGDAGFWNKEDRVLRNFDESFEYLRDSIIETFKLQCAKEQLLYEKIEAEPEDTQSDGVGEDSQVKGG